MSPKGESILARRWRKAMSFVKRQSIGLWGCCLVLSNQCIINSVQLPMLLQQKLFFCCITHLEGAVYLLLSSFKYYNSWIFITFRHWCNADTATKLNLLMKATACFDKIWLLIPFCTMFNQIYHHLLRKKQKQIWLDS